MSAAPETYRIEACCPHCGAPVRFQATRAQIEKWLDEPPHAVVGTYQCHRELQRRRRCDTIFPIRAEALQDAARRM